MGHGGGEGLGNGPVVQWPLTKLMERSDEEEEEGLMGKTFARDISPFTSRIVRLD